jgi:dipeptide/tripeptide permease
MEQAPTLQQIRDFKGTYPKQLLYLFGTEMWERFCFYGLRGMLTVFMVTELGLAEKAANLQYGAIQAFVYAFTFLGGVFADKILGFQKSLFWGALLMIVGGFTIAFGPEGALLHRHLLQHHRHGFLQAEHQHHGGAAVPRGRCATRCRVRPLLHGHQHRRLPRWLADGVGR